MNPPPTTQLSILAPVTDILSRVVAGVSVLQSRQKKDGPKPRCAKLLLGDPPYLFEMNRIAQ